MSDKIVRDKYPTEFIMYYTGDYASTIEQCYQTWLQIKDDPDFGIDEEGNPKHYKITPE